MLPEQTLDFEQIVNCMPGCFMVLQPNPPHYTILAISDELLHVTSKCREDVVGRGLFDVYPENPKAVTATGALNLRLSLQNAIEHKAFDQMPVVRYDVPNAAGVFETRYWSSNSRPVLNAGGELLYILHNTQDITEKVVAENSAAALKSLEEKYSLFMQAPMAVCIVTGPDNIIELSNNEMQSFYGLTSNIIGRPLFEAIPEARNQGFAEILDSVRKFGTTYINKEYATKLTVDGAEKLFYYSIVCQPYYKDVADSAPTGVFCLAHDVTEQVVTRLKVEESENRLQAIIEATPECIKIVSPEGKLEYMNPCGLEMIEGDDKLIGKASVLDVIAPEHRAEWLRRHKSICKGESLSWEFDIIGLNGTRRKMETHAVPLPSATGMYHLAVTRDVTLRNSSEVALRESEEKFRVFANNIQNLAWMAEPDGWIFWYNQRWFEYTGTTLEEMLGWGWEKVHHPDHIERVVSFVREAWLTGETWELTFPLRGADGEYRWFLTRAYAVKDAQGNVIRWVGTNTNVDQQKQAEAALEAKNKELTRINDDLDCFIYTASHDLKAPISNIEGLLEVLSAELSGVDADNSEIGHITTMMKHSIERFKHTITTLTDLVKLQQESLEVTTKVNLHRLVDEVLLDLEPLRKKTGAVIDVNLDGCDELYFREKNLRSVLLNLVSNGLKYSAPERVPFVRIACTAAAEYDVLTVEDNGLGVSEKNLGQMFTMFKRFHDHVEGTGIGLYMIKKMVESAGGFITVSSTLGVGTKFQVHLKTLGADDSLQ